MPTWLTGRWKNTRSPGRRSALATEVPTVDIARLVRGNETPEFWYAQVTRPEQSKAFGPVAPQRYGAPTLLRARPIAEPPVAAGVVWPTGCTGAATGCAGAGCAAGWAAAGA